MIQIKKWQLALLTLLTLVTIVFILPAVTITIPKSFPSHLVVTPEVQNSIKFTIVEQKFDENTTQITASQKVNLATTLAADASVDDLLKAKLAAINITDVTATSTKASAEDEGKFAYTVNITFPYLAYKYDYVAITDFLLNSTSLDKVVNRTVALQLDLSLIGINSKLFNFLPGNDFYNTWSVDYKATGATGSFSEDVNTIAARVKAAGLTDVKIVKTTSTEENKITFTFPSYYGKAQAESLANIFTRPGALQIWEHADSAEPNQYLNYVLPDYKPIPSNININSITDGKVEFNSTTGNYTWRVNFASAINDELQDQLNKSGYQLKGAKTAQTNPYKPLVISIDGQGLLVLVNPANEQLIGVPALISGDELTMKALLGYLTKTSGINSTLEGSNAVEQAALIESGNFNLLIVGLPVAIILLALIINRKESNYKKLQVIVSSGLWLVATIAAAKAVSGVINLNFVIAMYLVSLLSVCLLSYYSSIFTLRQNVLWILIFAIITVLLIQLEIVLLFINVFILWSIVGLLLTSWAFRVLPFYSAIYE